MKFVASVQYKMKQGNRRRKLHKRGGEEVQINFIDTTCTT